MKISQRGFSLVEISLVMLIIGLLMAGTITMVNVQRENLLYKDSQQINAQIKQALLSFVWVNKYLPCPDTDTKGSDNYGYENRAANGTCLASVGTVPFLNIGLWQANVRDAFNGKIRYAVNKSVTNLSKMQNPNHSASYFCNASCSSIVLPKFTLKTPPVSSDSGLGNYNICSSTEMLSCTNSSNKEAEGLSVVLVAFNKRGNVACGMRSRFEAENCDNDRFYWHADFNAEAGLEFDDTLLGISGYEIKLRGF